MIKQRYIVNVWQVIGIYRKIMPNNEQNGSDSDSNDLMLQSNDIITSSLSPEDERQKAIRAQRLKNLKPIQKGTVLNPTGKSGWTTGKNAMIELAMSAQHKAMKVLIKQLDSPDERIAQQASRELLDRAFGKAVSPTAQVDSKGDDVPPAPPMIVVGVQCK